MTTFTAAPYPTIPIPSPAGFLANTLTLARRELREAVRSRWFLLYTLAFAVLGLGLSFVTSAVGGGLGLSSFGRTTAGLVNLVLLVVPLMGLTAGAGSIAGDKERGMLTYLLAQPVSRTEVLLGKYLGLSGALIACITLGLGACAAIMAIKGDATRPSSLLWLGGLSLMLALGMLSLGMLVSVLARKASVAVGTGVFLWLVLVFATDLALMAGTIAMKLRIEELFALALINPLQVFKMWSLHAADASLDVLGPAGLYATEEYGVWLHAIFAGSLGAWIILPLIPAAFIFNKKAPV